MSMCKPVLFFGEVRENISHLLLMGAWYPAQYGNQYLKFIAKQYIHQNELDHHMTLTPKSRSKLVQQSIQWYAMIMVSFVKHNGTSRIIKDHKVMVKVRGFQR